MNIVINCERMKYANTGLFHFCLNLVNGLHQQRKENYPQLKAFIPASRKSLLSQLDAISQKEYHKLFKPVSGYDLWHETSQGESYFPANSRAKKVLTIHDLNVLLDETKSPSKKKQYIRKLQYQVDHSDAITTISQYSLGIIQQYLHLQNKPISVIYNGSNVPENFEIQQPAFMKNEFEYIFTIGTIVRKKNFHVLPALLKGNDLKLIIAGEAVDKNYLKEIEAEAKKHGVADRLIFCGTVSESEKWWLYSNMEAFVFPSIAEGFGLPVIEAMNFSRPVILSTHTSLPEIGGDHAYYFNSFDAEEMQHQLYFALADFKSAPQKAEEASEHAKSFNWNNAAREYWKVYSSLLNFQL